MTRLRLLVATSGLCVMAVEMTGLRLLAPHFGTSLLVTTALIGSLMGFLSLGYWLGGRWGDRHPTLPALCKVTAVAAALVVALPFISQPILGAASATLRPLIQGEALSEPLVAWVSLLGGILGTLALMAAPITLMGTVSPWAIRLAVDDISTSGAAAGRLYALSTAGSIIGTFLPALVLIPLLGVRNTFVIIGVTLLTVSGLGLLTGPRAALPLLAAGLLAVPQGTVRAMDGLVWESESIYHFIQVVHEPFGPCEDAVHLYLNEGVGVHSVKCTDPSREIRGVWNYMAAAPLWMDDPGALSDVLIVGLAGGTIGRQILDAFPEARVDGVEIDGDVVEVGRLFFDNDDPRIHPIVMDGRVFLQNTERTYDLILMDAYRQPYIPFHLVTREFFTLVHERLSDDGVLAVNVASVRGVSRSLAAMIYRTIREVFEMAVLIDATQSNDVIVATKRAKDPALGGRQIADHADRGGLRRIVKRLPKRIVGPVEGWEDAQVLTDDRAPVELAWDMMTVEYAR